jgi:DNA-binding MarR family transcriptional regulator
MTVPIYTNSKPSCVKALCQLESSEQTRTYRALMLTVGLLRRSMEPYFARLGVSEAQWGVLRALNCAEKKGINGLRLTDLSDRLLIRPPSVTAVVDRLQRAGLVARSASLKDQRACDICLTPMGRQLVQRAKKGHAERVAHILSAFDTDDQAHLQTLLERLNAHLEMIADEPLSRHAARGAVQVRKRNPRSVHVD